MKKYHYMLYYEIRQDEKITLDGLKMGIGKKSFKKTCLKIEKDIAKLKQLHKNNIIIKEVYISKELVKEENR